MTNEKKGFFGKYLLLLLYFILYSPLLMLVVYSFNTSAIPSPLSSFTLKWYRELFLNGTIFLCFCNSMIVAISSMMICIFLSLMLVYYKTIGGRIQKIIPAFYGSLVIPDTALAIALLTLYSTLNIPLGIVSIIIAHSIIGLGVTIPLIYLRYRELNYSLLEASYLLGASSFTTFRKIVIPFMLPAILGAGLMVFILSFDDFILAYFCAGSSGQTLSLYLVSSLRSGISPVINALTSLVLLFTISLVTAAFMLKRKEELETC